MLPDQSHAAGNREMLRILDSMLQSSLELLLPLSEKVGKFSLERKFYIKENISQKYKCGLI